MSITDRERIIPLRFVIHKGILSTLCLGLSLALWSIAGQTGLAADVLDIRVKPHWDRSEIVLDLDSIPGDIRLSEDNPSLISLQFSGSLNPALKQQVKTLTEQNLQHVYWEDSGGKIQLFMKRKSATKVKVYPLENPSRLVVRVDNEPAPIQNTKASRLINPGVWHHRMVKGSPRGPMVVNIVEVDMSNPEIVVEPVLASSATLHAKSRVSTMVGRNSALAGINASFFKPDTGTVLGTTIVNRELLSGPIYNRVALGITHDKKFRMDRLAMSGKLTINGTGQVPITNVNQPRLSQPESILYTPKWGRLAPPTARDCLSLQITGGSITQISEDRLSIPENGFVLITPRSSLTEALTIGQSTQMAISTSPDWSDVDHALSGGPYLIKDGQIFVDTQAQSFRAGNFNGVAPRTAVGYTADNRFLMVTVDGRQHNSVGASLGEMAHLMKSLGAVAAMNFDGGSSTQMVVGNQIVNSPTVAGGASVSASLIVRRLDTTVGTEIIGIDNDNNPAVK